MSKVLLRIYEFKLFRGIKEFHAEVVVFDKSISYSDEGIEVSVVTNKDGLEGYELCATYNLGYADIFEYEFQEFCYPQLESDYTAENYRLYTHNCRYFSLDVIHLLRPSKAEIGIKVLEDLNKMSSVLGDHLEIRSARKLTFLTSIVLFTLNHCYGTFVPIPMIMKDIIITTLFIIISFVTFCRR